MKKLWAWALVLGLNACTIVGDLGKDRPDSGESSCPTCIDGGLDAGPDWDGGDDAGAGSDGGVCACTASSCGSRVCGRSPCGFPCGTCRADEFCSGGEACYPGPGPGTPCVDAFAGKVSEGDRGLRRCPTDPTQLQSCQCTGGGAEAWFNCDVHCFAPCGLPAEDGGTSDAGPGADAGTFDGGNEPADAGCSCGPDSCGTRVCGRSSCGFLCGTCQVNEYCSGGAACYAGPGPGTPCLDAFGAEVSEGDVGLRTCPSDPTQVEACTCSGAGVNAWINCSGACFATCT